MLLSRTRSLAKLLLLLGIEYVHGCGCGTNVAREL